MVMMMMMMMMIRPIIILVNMWCTLICYDIDCIMIVFADTESIIDANYLRNLPDGLQGSAIKCV